MNLSSSKAQPRLALVNLTWTTGILIVIIVWNWSKSWVVVPNLVNILSVALSLSSLILALIAIFQAIFASGQHSQIMNDTKKAAENVLSASDALGSIAQEISSKVGALDEMSGTMTDVRNRVTEMAAKANAATAEAEGQANLPTSTRSAKAVFTNSAAGGFGAAYAVFWSFKRSKPFEYTDIDPSEIGMYKDGIISGLKMGGVIDVKRIDAKFVVTNLGVLDEFALKDWYAYRMKSKNENMRRVVSADFSAVNAYFGVSDAENFISNSADS